MLLHLEAPPIQQLQQLPVGPRAQTPLYRLRREGEHPEPPLPREGRVELSQTARRGVSGVGEGGLAGPLTLLIHPLEAGVGHVDLAPYLHEAGPSTALE